MTQFVPWANRKHITKQSISKADVMRVGQVANRIRLADLARCPNTHLVPGGFRARCIRQAGHPTEGPARWCIDDRGRTW